MKDFPNGISYYTKATLEVSFPENKVVCWWCPLLDTERGTSRPICRKTHEYLYDTERTIGDECPLKFNKKE